MKRKSHLLDFHELCAPEQNYIADFISLEIFFFFLCSIGGFLWEVLLMYLQEGHYVNRGFLYGPWIPVYGTGAVLFHILLVLPIYGIKSCLGISTSISFSMQPRKKKHFFSLFLSTALLGSLVELSVGYFLDTAWGLHYWDYSGYFLNFHGYICLWSALGFGVAGVLWVGVLSDIFGRFFFHLSKKKRRSLNTILLLLFVFDCVAALIFPNKGYGITFP